RSPPSRWPISPPRAWAYSRRSRSRSSPRPGPHRASRSPPCCSRACASGRGSHWRRSSSTGPRVCPRPARPESRRETRSKPSALLLLTALLLRNPLSYVYAVFPVVVWAALRLGPRGAATATAVVATLTIWYTLRGLGPFVASTPTENLALLQTFLGLMAVTGLMLAAVVTERGAVERTMEQGVAVVQLLQDVAVAANQAQ